MLSANKELDTWWFGENDGVASRVLLVVLACASVVQLLRGILLPNDWSYTHYLTGCEFGFVKRGLIGCIVEAIDYAPLYTYAFFSFTAVLLLLVVVSLVALVFLKAWRQQASMAALGAVVFICSPAIVFIPNIVGYYDFLGAALLLSTLLTNRLLTKLILLVLGFFILAFIHEGAVVIFLPLTAACFLVSVNSSRQSKAWTAAAMLGMALIFGALLLVANFTVTKQEVDLIFEGMKLKADHSLDASFMDVFLRDISTNRELMSWFKGTAYFDFFWRPQFWFDYGSAALIFTFGSALLLRRSTLPWYLHILCLASPYAVYALAIVAYDFHRWLSWSVFCSFILYLWLLARYPYSPGGKAILAIPALVVFCSFQVMADPVFLNPRDAGVFHIFDLIGI